MAIHVALTHRTQYRYSRLVGLGPHVVRLRPAPHCRTPILAYSLRITPEPHFINWQQDPFGNFMARIVVPDETREFSATVDLVADMATINPFDFFVEDAAANWPFSYEPVLAGELKPYLEPLPGTPLLDDYVRKIAGQSTTIAFVIDLNRRLSQDIAYQVRMEPGVQAPDETLARASGSCRDSGWLLVQILRRVGLAARFVSGYLIQLRPDDGGGGAGGPAEDFTDLHAWAEVYIPGAGWIGLDPTSGLLAGEGHIPLAATPSPTSAAPITGSHGAAEVDFSVTMRVERLHETPRVTKPYSDAQWQAILAAGAAVDARLTAGDVRLTMGGEPTFVALDDAAAPEWTIAALGPTKRAFRRQAGAGPVRALRHRRTAALRPRQMVSGRAGRSLGLRHPLAQRRRALMARCQPHRRGTTGNAGDHCRCGTVCRRALSRPWPQSQTARSQLTRMPPTSRCPNRSCRSASRPRTTSWPSRRSASA